MIYQNPIIVSDYSDPDVIRHGDSFYMIASSFNHTPGVPVLKSKNLVDWKLIGYVYNNLPFDRFNDKVYHGEGAWAPSLRYHNGKFYAVIPFPDEGIYVSECTDIEKGDWSPLWPLIEGRGLEDPCPLWIDDKCYLVIGFVKSRIGFNSLLAVYEVSTDLKTKLSDYKIIFDGHNTQPTIEGPKFYYINDYIYILAPAGSVKTGWQTALRSKNVYGPYEEKIVMFQGDAKTNGPHQGALIDLEDGKYAFIHFQDKQSYGRIVHLQPVEWHNDWPMIGLVKDPLIPGVPVDTHEYLVNVESDYKILASDSFDGDKLSLIWQTPANIKDSWYKLDNGLTLYPLYNEEGKDALNLQPNLFLTKILYNEFSVECKMELNLVDGKADAGFGYMGKSYAYLRLIRRNDSQYLEILTGNFSVNDVLLADYKYDGNEITFNMEFLSDQTYRLGVNGNYFEYVFKAEPGRWIGGKYGFFERGLDVDSQSTVKVKDFKVVEICR